MNIKFSNAILKGKGLGCDAENWLEYDAHCLVSNMTRGLGFDAKLEGSLGGETSDIPMTLEYSNSIVK